MDAREEAIPKSTHIGPCDDPSKQSATLEGLPGPELTVVIPTFNERDNVAELIARLRTSLAGRRWEVIFVDDDSPDGTCDAVREWGRTDHRIRCVHRIGRRGLSSACIEGILASSAPYVAVMDGDLQHDEALLPQMYNALSRTGVDLVIASRYVEGGGIGDWQSGRALLSRLGVRFSRLVIPSDVKDPMSGFFMLRRTVFEECVHRLSALGFKILIDVFASAPRPLTWRELPFRFRTRHAGESKLDSVVMWDFAMLLLDKSIGRVLPVRFIAFTIVGGIGFAVHLATVAVLLETLGRPFAQAQGIATVVAMTFNYAVNNVLTYRDRRLRGWQWLRGWAAFLAVCSVGAIGNVGIAAYVYRLDEGWVPAAAAGVLVGAVWNFAATNVFTWSKPGRVAGRKSSRRHSLASAQPTARSL